MACSSSFVFVGSWPETILLALTIKLAPEINSKTYNIHVIYLDIVCVATKHDGSIKLKYSLTTSMSFVRKASFASLSFILSEFSSSSLNNPSKKSVSLMI